jgi:hypothetical protein
VVIRSVVSLASIWSIIRLPHPRRGTYRIPAAVFVGGPTPRYRESDNKVARGHVTKQGSRLLRWALIEAVQPIPCDSITEAIKDAITARLGKEAKNIAKVAAPRLVRLILYGLRDGQIRRLSPAPTRPLVPQPPARATKAACPARGQARGRLCVCRAARAARAPP